MRIVATTFGLGAAICAANAISPLRADNLNDYPTTARVDYVFGVIATILPYERYVTAETVLSMAQVPGTLGNQFRSTEYAKAAVDELRRAQAEAEVRCF